jgi:hypothetical protein
MRRPLVSAFLAMTAVGMSMTVPATSFPTASGTIINLVVNSNSTLDGGVSGYINFGVTNMPNTGCPSGGYFTVDPTDITDAQTYKNMVTTLFAAKLSGATVNVVYSSTFCSSGQFSSAVPIAIIIP